MSNQVLRIITVSFGWAFAALYFVDTFIDFMNDDFERNVYVMFALVFAYFLNRE